MLHWGRLSDNLYSMSHKKIYRLFCIWITWILDNANYANFASYLITMRLIELWLIFKSNVKTKITCRKNRDSAVQGHYSKVSKLGPFQYVSWTAPFSINKLNAHHILYMVNITVFQTKVKHTNCLQTHTSSRGSV